MKRLALIIIFILLVNLNYNEKIITTFKENLDNSFYILEFPNNNLSSNNFLDYFDNIQVIWIEINTNLKVKKQYNYTTIEELKKNYLEELKINNYKLEAINYQISGIIINKIKVYSNLDKLNKLNIENMVVNG